MHDMDLVRHAAADALLYHAPNVCAFAPGQERPMRRRKGQPLVVYSMESVGRWIWVF